MSHCLPWSACIFQPNIWMKQGWREVGASFVSSSLRQLKLNELLNSSPYPNHSTLVKCLGRTSKSSVWKNAWQSGTHIYLGRLSAPSCTTALPFSLISVTERERERPSELCWLFTNILMCLVKWPLFCVSSHKTACQKVPHIWKLELQLLAYQHFERLQSIYHSLELRISTVGWSET